MIKKGSGLVENENKPVVVLNNIQYIAKHKDCKTCEWSPPCILCNWLSRESIADIYDDLESYMVCNRKQHVKNKQAKMRMLGLREGLGRGTSSKNYKRKEGHRGRKGQNPMVI